MPKPAFACSRCGEPYISNFEASACEDQHRTEEEFAHTLHSLFCTKCRSRNKLSCLIHVDWNNPSLEDMVWLNKGKKILSGAKEQRMSDDQLMRVFRILLDYEINKISR